MQNINETTEFLHERGITKPEIGIVLGTGLGKMVDIFDVKITIPYEDIPNFPVSTVESHKGRLIFGELEGKTVLAMQGRFHYYEGYSLQEVTFPIRVMGRLGIKYLILSNAAGSMNLAFKKGSLMLIDDHINFLPDNPLRGKNLNLLGPRFPDMSQPYSKYLNDRIKAIAKKENINLYEGVYVAVPGPNFETRAEYRMFRNLADAVGMSTVPEVIVANHMQLPCAAISVLTDECDPDNLVPATLDEVLKVAGKAETDLVKLMKAFIKELD